MSKDKGLRFLSNPQLSSHAHYLYIERSLEQVDTSTHIKGQVSQRAAHFFLMGQPGPKHCPNCLMATNHSSVRTKQNRVKLNNTTINCPKVNLQFITISCFPTQRPSLFTRNNESLLHATAGTWAHIHAKTFQYVLFALL